MVKKIMKKISLLLAIVLGPILMWEVFLQIDLWFISKDPYDRIMYRDVHHKINSYWNAGYENKRIFWGPPYNVFLNRGEDDPERLKLIHEKSIMPTDHNGLSENFLRPESDPKDSQYKVTINKLGFRGPERDVKKPKGTYRVFVLGSYPSFGSGVNDNETYSYYLEEILNKKFNGKKKVEVWNGGQQGTTAISGYARLLNEIKDYEPDLLIWDFGWVDLYFGKDFVDTEYSKGYSYPFIQEAARILWRRFPYFLFSRKLYHFMNRDFRKVLLDDWKRVNKKMIDYVEKENLPTLMLKQRVVIIPTPEYTELANSSDKVSFVDFQSTFRDPKLSISEADKREFWSTNNWLSEGGISQEDEMPEERMLRVDVIMYNKFAHKIIADKLAEIIDIK